MSEKLVLISMLKKSLDDIIEVPFADGYTMRSYKKGDRDMWVELYNSLDEYSNVSAKDFDESFGDDHDDIAKRMFFLCFNGKEIGTITNWAEEDTYGKKTARLHWVGVDPGHRGKRLGAALTSFILKNMKEHGSEQVVLGTQEVRHAALNMYFKFGFVPAVINDKYSPIEDQKLAWMRVKPHMPKEYAPLIDF